MWHSTFGNITVKERLFIGKLYRRQSAGVHYFACSQPLQRVLVDFGSDNAFAKACQKVKEHYGVEISVSTLRQQTQQHAKQMYEQAQEDVKMPERAGCKQQIGEMDDCMIPIITIDENADDKRKNKKLQWKAATLSLVHDSVTPRAVGNVTDAGRNSAILAGFGQQTHLHAVGDGAPWIAKQVQAQFGEKSSYLVDFYHVCEYLAAQHCTTEDKQTWLEKKCVKE